MGIKALSKVDNVLGGAAKLARGFAASFADKALKYTGKAGDFSMKAVTEAAAVKKTMGMVGDKLRRGADELLDAADDGMALRKQLDNFPVGKLPVDAKGGKAAIDAAAAAGGDAGTLLSKNIDAAGKIDVKNLRKGAEGLGDAAGSAGKSVDNLADAARKNADEIAAATGKNADVVADATTDGITKGNKAFDDVIDAGGSVADAGRKKLDEVAGAGKKIYGTAGDALGMIKKNWKKLSAAALLTAVGAYAAYRNQMLQDKPLGILKIEKIEITGVIESIGEAINPSEYTFLEITVEPCCGEDESFRPSPFGASFVFDNQQTCIQTGSTVESAPGSCLAMPDLFKGKKLFVVNKDPNSDTKFVLGWNKKEYGEIDLLPPEETAGGKVVYKTCMKCEAMDGFNEGGGAIADGAKAIGEQVLTAGGSLIPEEMKNIVYAVGGFIGLLILYKIFRMIVG